MADDFSQMDAIIASVAADLYNEKITKGTIPQALYEQTADTLLKAVFSGVGGSGFSYDDPKNELVAYLRQNTYSFSAAKSLTEMKLFNDLLIGEDGKLRSEAQFTAEVAKLGVQFNKVWLATERNNAIAQAQMAQAWDEFQSNAHVIYLQITTAGDDKVRPWHAILHGFTALKSAAVWLRLWPPFDWNCRCSVIPGKEENAASDYKTAALLDDAKVPEYFRTNSGRTRTIANSNHTYYQNSFKKEKQLTAIDNYGMQPVGRIYANNSFKPATKLASRAEADSWWNKQTEDNDFFDIVDFNKVTIRFDKQFKNHVLEDNKDDRWENFANIPDIIHTPDEVWSIRNGSSLETIYIKYYEDYPYAVRVNATRAYTMNDFSRNGKLNEASLESVRRGILLYRKN